MPTAEPPHDRSRQVPDGDPDRPPDVGRAGSPDPVVPASVLRWRRIGLVLVGIEAVAPLAFAGYGVLQLLTGQAVVARNEAMLSGLLALAGVGLLLIARRVGQGRSGVRTASLLWQVLLVLGLVPSMWQGGQQPLAVAVVAFTALTGYATVRATSADPLLS